MTEQKTAISPPITVKDDDKAFCRDLLEQMTLEEKIGQMVQADLSWNQDVETLIREGRVGSVLTINDVEKINSLQEIAVKESRLGIPLLLGNDAIHSYRTVFPIPLALASSWDTLLIKNIAKVIRDEALASGTNWTFAPMVDISRDPRWGRVAEGAGEDPYLGSVIAQSWVAGFQEPSNDLKKQMAACVKHFAAYGAVESGKDYNTVDMSERRLREVYLPPYKAAIDAGALTLMTSFNELNGVPATANRFLLQDILRNEWGFDGVIISDYDSIGELIYHGYARDHREAAYLSILAGIDIDMMGNAYHFHLADLVCEGIIEEELIDQSVMRILSLKFKLGVFNNPYIDRNVLQNTLLKPEFLNLAEKAAEESTVLLKNANGLLPIKPEEKKIALIGPLADERQSLLGSWIFDGKAEDTESLLEVLTRSLPSETQLIYSKGCSINGSEIDFKEAVDAAKEADIIIMAVGETDEMSGEAHSRAHIGLPGAQQALFETMANTGKPIITVLFTGRPLAIPWIAEKTTSMLLAWQGGTKCAQAISNILFGKAAPCGKIPVSFPRSEGQIPVYYAHKSTGRPFDSAGTMQFNAAHKSIYLDESNLPLYPFGFGLSYTTFIYSNLVIETSEITKNDSLNVKATISNTGNNDGYEIVQCYIRDLFGSVTRPVKELKGFHKIFIKAGTSRDVQFTITPEDLSFIGPDLRSTIEPGDFSIWIGPNSQAGLKGSFRVLASGQNIEMKQ
jgi:beta-glucosidase